MLPGFLKSTYAFHKEDTDFIAMWLASTARAHGYPLDALSNVAADTSDRRAPKKKKKKKNGKAPNLQPVKMTALILLLLLFLQVQSPIRLLSKTLFSWPDTSSPFLSKFPPYLSAFCTVLLLSEESTIPGSRMKMETTSSLVCSSGSVRY